MRTWWLAAGLALVGGCSLPPSGIPPRDAGSRDHADVTGTTDIVPDIVDVPVADAAVDAPDAADVPSPPDVPDVANAPDVPAVMDAPDATGTPDVADTPDVFDAPPDTPCPTGQTRCGDGTCIEPDFSDARCGGCDRPACPPGRTCTVGRCVVNASDLALGFSHSCVRVARAGCNGTFCWGDDGRCALGLRAPDLDAGVGAGVADASPSVVCAQDAGVVNFAECVPYRQQSTAAMLRDFGRVIGLAAGYSHTCALVDDPAQHGTVYCWGSNAQGQIGDGTRRSQPAPARVTLPGTAARAVQVAAGGYHTCALTAAGEVYCWGSNSYGELGSNRACGSITCTNVDHNDTCYPAPTRVGDLPAASQVAAGVNHTCVVTRAGTVMCWGANDQGQLGVYGGRDGGVGGHEARVPVSGLINVVQVTVGSNVTCALTADGEVYCWGSNGGCNLGTSTSLNSSHEPVLVRGLTGTTQVAAGFAHLCALRGGSSTVSCWGYNAQHQLGVPQGPETQMTCAGTTGAGRQTPVVAAGVADAGVIRQVAVNGYHTCALTDRQEVLCWGYDNVGQLGDNLRTDLAPDIARPVIGICP